MKTIMCKILKVSQALNQPCVYYNNKWREDYNIYVCSKRIRTIHTISTSPSIQNVSWGLILTVLHSFGSNNRMSPLYFTWKTWHGKTLNYSFKQNVILLCKNFSKIYIWAWTFFPFCPHSESQLFPSGRFT